MNNSAPTLRSKIFATLGPATNSVEIITRLIDEGVRVFRINFSHGTFDGFMNALNLVREAAQITGIHVSALGDICGPKIRLGKIQPDGIMLNVGDKVIVQQEQIFAHSPVDGGAVILSTNSPEIIPNIEEGHRLLINDGNVRLLVTEKVYDAKNIQLKAHVTMGGLVTSAKGLNIPDTELTLPSITPYDWECIDWAIKNELDFLALSFVRNAKDVEQLQAYLLQNQITESSIPVIAKIELPQAIRELESIVKVSYGIMVARGDLGVEMDIAQVPVLQKRIIRICHEFGKPVIVATQMLESMIDAPMPTRAEVSDVANAIFDGADAVMLSGETAVGKYPIQAVHNMARVARIAEENMKVDPRHYIHAPKAFTAEKYRSAALAHGVDTIVKDIGAKLIVIWSQKGGGARFLSQYRPEVPILAASSDLAMLRKMSLLFAVNTVHLEQPSSVDDFISVIDPILLKEKWAKEGDSVVVVAGEPIGMPGVTNSLLIHYVGDVCKMTDKAK